MRMWMVPPEVLCRQHLLGEHAECHYARMMVTGERRTCMAHNLQWFMDRRLVEVQSIKSRHDQLVEEMKGRGWTGHKTPMDEIDTNLRNMPIDREKSYRELEARCIRCRERMKIALLPSNVIAMYEVN